MSNADRTPITELNSFFPVSLSAPRTIRAVPMRPGETREEAERRADERRERIERQIAEREAQR